MSKIDLLKIAKQVNELYEDVPNSWVGTVRVYHVPDTMLLSATLDRPEPEQPTVKMKLATGGTQNRLSKPGDKVYDSWISEKVDYDAEMFRLRSAIRMVFSLKDIEYPDTSVPPGDTAIGAYNGHWPANEVLQKKIWLDFTILSKRSDSDKIYEAISRMNGQEEPTEDDVDVVKKDLE